MSLTAIAQLCAISSPEVAILSAMEMLQQLSVCRPWGSLLKLMKSNKERQNIGRDLLLYIAIALLIAAVAGAYGVYLARKGEEPNFKNDWSVTMATAALVFGYAIRHSWRLRKFWSFWAMWFAPLVGHFAILLPILSRMEKVPLVLIGLIAPLEVFIVYATLDFVVGHLDSRHS